MSRVGWEDFEKPNYGVIRGGLSGQSGYMPPDLHMKKLEQTPMYEREGQLNDYFRSTLKDRTLDAPSFAQDMPKETQNMLRSEVLNLRHSGARTPAEPVHPDLFLGFTERDSRGSHNSGPDMRKYADQSRSRGKFKDFVSDHASDWTISGGNRSNMRANLDLRKTIGWAKDRMKIFDTAIDGRTTSFQGQRTSGSTVPLHTSDSVLPNLNDTSAANYRDNTSVKGDTIKVGYRQTGSHKFSVAQYGLTSSRQHTSNIYSAQQQTAEDRKFDIHPSEIKTRLMINMIKEVDRRKHLDEYRHDMQDSFGGSVNAANKIQKLVAELSTTQQNTEQTADVVDLAYLSSNIKKVRVYDPVAHDTVIVDKDIFDKVKEHKNISFVKRSDPTARHAIADEGKKHLPGDNVGVHVYTRKQPTVLTQLPVKTDQEWTDTDFAPVYKRGQMTSGGFNAQQTELGQGVDPHADVVFDRYTKGAGYIQGVRSNIDENRNIDPVNDAEGYRPRAMRGRSKI